MPTSPRAALVLAFSALLVAPTARAEDDSSGVSPSRLKLPSGPGSLEGVGENAEVNINMGLVSYAVPFAVPAGYSGLTPSLGLSYSSAGGPSLVGLGWNFNGAPRIERMTARGLPLYDGTDGFATEGGSELVRLPGTQTYRERFEGSFTRYTWVDPGGLGEAGYFKAEFADGRVAYFGATSDGTLVPEARLEGAYGTFAYHLVELVDTFDRRIRYHYEKPAGGHPLITRIEWAFDGSETPRYSVELSYEARADALSDGKPGVEVRLEQRLTGVRVLVRGAQLRRYELTYEPYAVTGGLSRLSKVETFGTGDATPYPIAFRFEYTQGFDPLCVTPGSCKRPFMQTLGSVGANFQTGDVDFVDMNGDALPDVIDTREGVHRVHQQTLDTDGVASLLPVWVSAPAGSGAMMLSSSEVQMVDLNGDGFVDMVDGLNHAVLYGSGDGDWSSRALRDTRLPHFSGDANLRFLDLDYDRHIDVVHLGQAGSWVYKNLGNDTFSPVAEVISGVGKGFVEDGVQLADLNGDGMLDLAQVVPGAVFYHLNLGHGEFTSAIEMLNLPGTLSPAEVQLTDLNGDGLADAVIVQGTEVRFALNRAGLDFGPLYTLTSADVEGSIPERTGEVSVRFADMNGSGSKDVVWIDASGLIQFLELFPERPNLLRRIDNSVGKTILAEYGTTVSHMARDGGPDAWSHRLPHAMQVLERLITFDALSGVGQVQTFHYRDGYYDGEEHQFRGFAEVEVFTEGDASMETGYALHRFDVGATDRYKKGLELEKTVSSDGRTISVERREYDDCEVEGVPSGTALPVRFVCPTRSTTELREGRSEAEWVTLEERQTYDGYGNVIRAEKLGVTQVGGGGCRPCDRAADVQGEACGESCLGDESTEVIDYVDPSQTGGRWLLRAPALKRVFGVTGSSVIKEERTYYDGPEFEGLALGRLTRGVVTRVEAKKDATSSVNVQRMKHDAHGNVVEALDANGHRRTFGYDPDGLLLTSEEAHFDDPSREATYGLRLEVSYAPVLETIDSSTSWMRTEGGGVVSARRETRYGYDEYGRLTAIAQPGDELGMPTQAFEYHLADPVSRIVSRSRSQSGGVMDLEHVQCFDGLGRKVQERTRIDSSRVQVSGFSLFNVQGKEHRTYQPYVSTSAECEASAPGDVLYSETFFDATGRPVRVNDPDDGIYGSRSETRLEYAPLRTTTHDGEDLDPQSPHFGTPSTTVTDGLGRMVRLERLLKNPIEADGGLRTVSIELRYDALGRLNTLIDDHGNAHTQDYDLLDRIVEVRHPDSGVTQMTYDDAGNRLRTVDARGKTTEVRYDEANRRTRMWDADAPMSTFVEWRYDGEGDCAGLCTFAEGELSEVTYPLLGGERGADRFGYDARGRGVHRQVSRGGTSYEFADHYDHADRPIGTTYPGGLTIAAQLDAMGRVTSVPGIAPEVTYTARNQMARTALWNGVETSHAYDDVLRLRTLRASLPSGDSPLDYLYEYDREGHITAIEDGRPLRDDEPSETADYTYDSLYRLVRAHLDPGREAAKEEVLTYGYDTVDNIVRKTSSLGDKGILDLGEMRYGEDGAGPHALTTIGADKPDAIVERWRYDLAGNVVQHGDVQHAWDHLGRLAESQLPSGEVAEYAYGPSRQRTQKREKGSFAEYLSPDFEVRNGIATAYVRLGDQRVARVERAELAANILPDLAPLSGTSTTPNSDGAITAADAWLFQEVTAGRLDADLDPGLSARVAGASVEVMLASAARRTLLGEDGEAVTALHGNHQGTVVAETDEEGALLSRSIAYPYGHPRYTSGALPEYWYTGQEWDRATGLSYHSARYLDLRVGRWASPDPFFEWVRQDAIDNGLTVDASLRLVYSRSSPISLVDSSGCLPFLALPGLVGLLGGTAGAVHALATGGSIGDAGKGFAIGFATGFAGTIGASLAVSAATVMGATALAETAASLFVGGVFASATNAVMQAAIKKTVDRFEMARAAVFGGIASVATKGLSVQMETARYIESHPMALETGVNLALESLETLSVVVDDALGRTQAPENRRSVGIDLTSTDARGGDASDNPAPSRGTLTVLEW